MLRATIDDLRTAVGGTLRLAEQPPVHGERTILTGITHYLSELIPGQIYWPLDPWGDADQRLAEEAFAAGAVGVVCAKRHITPWAGCWSLEVADTWRAWLEWQAWAEKHDLTWDDYDGLCEPRYPQAPSARFRPRGETSVRPAPLTPPAAPFGEEAALPAVVRMQYTVEQAHERLD